MINIYCNTANCLLLENTDYESTVVAKRRIDARERAHACTHTHTRTLSFLLPVSQRVPSPNGFPLNSSARRKTTSSSYSRNKL